MKIAERLLEQAKVIEDADSGNGSVPDLEAIKENLYNAAQEIDRLEAEVKERDEKITNGKDLVALGGKKIQETKDETLRLLKTVCEHSETKDMGRHDRMKERFEKESLKFEDIERYLKDAQAEFDALFPVSGKAKGEDPEGKPTDKNKSNLDLSAFKIEPKK